MGAYKTAVFRDKDGSVGGVPNSYILINDGVNDSIAIDAEACEIKPTWNAAVCKGDVGRLTVGGPAVVAVVGGARGAGGRGGAPQVPVLAVAAVPALALAWWPGGGGPGAPKRSVLARPGATCSAASRSQPQWQGVHRNRAPTYEPVPRSR